MTVQATPAANFVMVQTQLLFGLAKTALHRPALKSHMQQPSQREATLPRHAIRYEVFHLLRQDVACHDQAVPTPRQAIGPLPPEHRPFHFPDFGSALRVLDAITLPPLFAEYGRIARQVLHFARGPATRQTRILFLTAPTRPLRRRAVAQHPRLDHPAVEVGRHFSHEYLPTLF